MIARGTKISLRLPKLSDMETMIQWENDDEIIQEGNSPSSGISLGELKQFIQNGNDFISNRQLRLMIIDHFGKSVGTLDFFHYEATTHSCELGILITPIEMRCKGYASDAISEGLQYGHHVLDIHTFMAKVKNDNLPSIQLFQKAGFTMTETDPGIFTFIKRF